jgi:hypothetical protein
MKMKDQKSLFIEEAKLKGQLCKGNYNPSFNSVEKRHCSLIKFFPSKEKPVERFKI